MPLWDLVTWEAKVAFCLPSPRTSGTPSLWQVVGKLDKSLAEVRSDDVVRDLDDERESLSITENVSCNECFASPSIFMCTA